MKEVAIRYSQITGLFRGYLSNDDHPYEHRERFIGVTTVSWVGDEEVFLQGALITQGVGFKMLIEILKCLAEMRVRKVRLKREIRHTFPFGTIIDEGVFENTWEIILSDLDLFTMAAAQGVAKSK